MKKLLEAINRGILKGLNENNIELLADLDDGNLDQLDSIQTKSVNNKIHALYKYFPTTKEELVEIIKAEVEKNGWECSLNHIDTSKITDMSSLFSGAYDGYDLEYFNGDISRWNVSNVKDMRDMFWYAKSFNQPIGDWDVSNVINMECMFDGAVSFNQPIGNWNVPNVTTMEGMFCNAKSFNQPIGDWDVYNVKNTACMFQYASSFNQDLSSWNVKSVKVYVNMFYDCPIEEEYKPKGIK